MMEYVIISLGGSLLFKNGGINSPYLKKFSDFIVSQKKSFGVVVGGGIFAKQYIDAARGFKQDNYDLDLLGIEVTRANARLAKAALRSSLFFYDIEQATDYLLLMQKKAIAVIGGTAAGQTTDTVAALLAENIPAKRFVNLSNVDAIYDKNPKLSGARKIHSLNHDELVKMAAAFDKREPRTNFVIDLLAAEILARSKIEAHFVNGNNWNDVESAVNGEKHGGTVVK